jgi:hypothetical protein
VRKTRTINNSSATTTATCLPRCPISRGPCTFNAWLCLPRPGCQPSAEENCRQLNIGTSPSNMCANMRRAIVHLVKIDRTVPGVKSDCNVKWTSCFKELASPRSPMPLLIGQEGVPAESRYGSHLARSGVSLVAAPGRQNQP